MKKLLCSALLLAMTLAAQAEVKLPKIFGDNMVLQQQTECNLWGTADANKVVKVRASWNGKTYKTQADAQGKWAMKIETPQAGGPYELSLSDGKELKLHNILIGEVWICSGQSNMEMPMKGFKAQPVAGTPEELMLCKDQQLRLFTVQRNAQLHPVDTVAGDWKEADAASVREFSAAAYYYGKTLRQSLGVPVGLIVTSWGGSACEAWINGNLIKSDWLKAFPKLHTPWNEADVKKYQQRRLKQYRRRDPIHKGMGDIICCLDESGSTRGDAAAWGKAVVMTLLDIAAENRRKFALIHFAGSSECKVDVFLPGQYSMQDKLNAAETFLGGGTNFKRPLDEAIQLMNAGFENADIVFLTDGLCELPEDYLAKLYKEQAARKFTVTGILLDAGNPGMDFSLTPFCQKIYRTSELAGDEIVRGLVTQRM